MSSESVCVNIISALARVCLAIRISGRDWISMYLPIALQFLVTEKLGI